MRILFINPPLKGDTSLPTKPFPIGTLILDAILGKNGFESILISPDSYDELLFFLKNNTFDVFGIVCFTRQRFSAIESARICKQMYPSSTVVLGGPHTIGLENIILEKYDFIDSVISGEAELSFLKYLTYLGSKKEKHIPNVFTRVTSQSNKIYPLNAEVLSKLPLPNYYNDYFKEYAQYSRGNMYFGANNMAAIQLSRGCNNKCIFCANQAIFGKHKCFELNYIINHINHLVSNFDITYIHFVDDNFCGDKNLVQTLCEYIISNNIYVVWRCSTRIDSVDNITIDLMAQAGCKMISFGVESLNQEVLNEIKKGIDIATIKETVKLCQFNNIEVRFSLTFGYKKDKNINTAEIANVLNELKPNAIALYLLKVYPGTELYEMAKKEKFISDEWWFNNQNDAPFYTKNISYQQFQEIKAEIIDQLKADIVSSYKENRDDSEYYLKWNHESHNK